LYDKYGKEAVSNQSFVDPKLLFKMLFGGGRFEDVYGELTFLTTIIDGYANVRDA